MACCEHTCRRCGKTVLNNRVRTICPRCGSDDMQMEYDEPECDDGIGEEEES